MGVLKALSQITAQKPNFPKFKDNIQWSFFLIIIIFQFILKQNPVQLHSYLALN